MVLSMDRWRNKVAVVTGVTGAVGEAVAEQLVEEGLEVVGVDVRSDRFDELSKKFSNKKGKFYSFRIDIVNDKEVVDFFKKIALDIGPVHILVNCAAIVQQTDLIEGDTEKWRRVLDTNVLGLCIMTREAVKIMKANEIDGHIVHISSVCGHYVPPNVAELNVYPASKSAVRSLTETLRLEMIRLGLKTKITCISPGKLSSLMAVNNGFVISKELSELLKNMPMLDPSDIADAITYVLSTPPHVQVHEMVIKPVGAIH